MKQLLSALLVTMLIGFVYIEAKAQGGINGLHERVRQHEEERGRQDQNDNQRRRGGHDTEFTMNELKGIHFFGVEPNFRVKIEDDKVVMEFVLDDDPAMNAHFYPGRKFEKTGLGNQIRMRAKEEPITERKTWTLLIDRKICSDGMSDNNYPYSIKILWGNGREYQGCGRKL